MSDPHDLPRARDQGLVVGEAPPNGVVSMDGHYTEAELSQPPASPGMVAADLRWCIFGNLLLRLGNSATGVLMGLLLATMDRTRGDVPAIAVGLLAASFYATELVGAPIFGTLSDLLSVVCFHFVRDR